MDFLGIDFIKPDIFILHVVINCFCHLNRVDFGFSIFGNKLKLGYEPDIKILSALIKGLCIGGKIIAATRVIVEIVDKGFKPDLITMVLS